MNVLVADKAEKLVLDKGAAQRSAGGVAVQFRHFFIGGNIVVLLVEIRRSVQPIRSAMHIGSAMNGIGAGGSAHVDVGAAGGTLLRVVHGSVHAKFLNCFRGRGRQRLANGQIGRRRALNDLGGGAARAGHSGIVHNARGSHLAGALAVEQIAGVDAVQQKGIAGVALAVGPDRLIAQTAVGPGSVAVPHSPRAKEWRVR